MRSTYIYYVPTVLKYCTVTAKDINVYIVLYYYKTTGSRTQELTSYY